MRNLIILFLLATTSSQAQRLHEINQNHNLSSTYRSYDRNHSFGVGLSLSGLTLQMVGMYIQNNNQRVVLGQSTQILGLTLSVFGLCLVVSKPQPRKMIKSFTLSNNSVSVGINLDL